MLRFHHFLFLFFFIFIFIIIVGHHFPFNFFFLSYLYIIKLAETGGSYLILIFFLGGGRVGVVHTDHHICISKMIYIYIYLPSRFETQRFTPLIKSFKEVISSILMHVRRPTSYEVDLPIHPRQKNVEESQSLKLN